MKTNQYILFVLICTLLNNCSVSKNVSDKNILIELEKTSCRGYCPVFKVKIASNGFVIYEGMDNVEMTGIYKSKLSKDQLSSIIDSFYKVNFFDFKNSYKSLMMDLPTKYISFAKNGQKKRIKAYDNIPKELISLIEQIDKLIEQLEWRKVN